MAIITISRGSFSKGSNVARLVARTLGYDCISREVLLEASEHFNIPEIKLERTLHDAPSILERFTYGKERYLAYIASAFLERMQKGNVVYHGLAGQFFLRGVSHVLKVRILADLEDRAALEMERESLTRERALERLRRDDEERRRWSMHLYGVDTWDPGLYDLVVHVHKLRVDDAAKLICECARLDQFEATPESQQVLEDLILSARVRARLVPDYPTTDVQAASGVVTICARFNQTLEPSLTHRIQEVAEEVEGVEKVHLDVVPVNQTCL